MLTDPGIHTEDERDLLARAAGWPGCACLAEATHAALARLASEQGMDFATALLYDRLCRSDQHGPFIHRINELLSQPREGEAPAEPKQMDVLLAVAPGAYYRELPATGRTAGSCGSALPLTAAVPP